MTQPAPLPPDSVPVQTHAGDTIGVSPAEAQRAYAQGNATLRGQVRVAKGQQTGTVDASQLQGALANDWRVIGDQEAAQIKLDREESSAAAQIQGGAEALARGATVGLSDVAIAGLGGDAERLAARKKHLGAGADLLEVGGAIAPAFLTGGASAGAQTAGRLGMAARTAARLSPAGALELGASALGRGAAARFGGGALARVGGMATAGAVEGAASGLGAHISEATLGDQDIVSERALMRMAEGFVVGGASGVLLPGMVEGARRGAKIPVQATRKILSRAADVAPDSLPDFMVKAMAGGSAKSEEGIRNTVSRIFKSKESRAQLHRAWNDRAGWEAEGAGVVRTAAKEFQTDIDGLIQKSEGLARRDAVSKRLPGTARSADIAEELDGIHTGLSRRIEEARASGEAIPARLEAFRKRLETAVYDAADADSAADAYMVALRVKRDAFAKINEWTPTKFGKRVQVSDIENINLRETITAMRGSVIDRVEGGVLSNQEKFGDAAKWYREMADADRKVFNLKADPVSRRIIRGEASDADAITFARRVSSPRHADNLETVDTYFDDQINALRKRAEFHDSDELRSAIKSLERSRDKFRGAVKDQVEMADILDATKSMGLGGTLSGMIAAAGPSGAMVTGGILGGLPGAAVGGALNMIARPQQTLRTLGTVLHMADRAGLDVDRVTGKFRSKITGKGKAAKATRSAAKEAVAERKARREKRPSRRVPARIAARSAILSMSDDRTKEQESTRDRLQLLASNPAALQASLAETMAALDDDAPELAAAIQVSSQRAAAFLASKAPNVHTPPPGGGPPIVDRVAADKFDRYLDAVLDPIGTMEELADGTMGIEAIEALEVVYPKHFEALQAMMLEVLGESAEVGKKIPYRMRMQMSLFGLPTVGRPAPSTGQAEEDAEAMERAKPRRLKTPKEPMGGNLGTNISRLEGGIEA